jgi:hypothetical protein
MYVLGHQRPCQVDDCGTYASFDDELRMTIAVRTLFLDDDDDGFPPLAYGHPYLQFSLGLFYSLGLCLVSPLVGFGSRVLAHGSKGSGRIAPRGIAPHFAWSNISK